MLLPFEKKRLKVIYINGQLCIMLYYSQRWKSCSDLALKSSNTTMKIL